MKHFIFIVSLLLYTKVASAQPKLNIDSLQKLLSATKEDTTRIILMAQISSDFTFYNPDSAFELVKRGLQLAQRINYSKGENYCRTTLGKLWWSIGDYSAALGFLLPLVKNAETTTDAWLRINILGFINATYRDQGDYREALKYAFKFVYLEDTYDQCKLCRHCYTAIAAIYLEMRQLDSTLFYLHRAFGYPPIFGDDGWMYLIAARTQAELNNYDSAFYFYRQSIPVLTLEENQKDLAGAFNNIASLFAKLKRSDSAFLYARKALSIASTKQYFREFMIANLILSKVYESLNTDSAFMYHKSAMAAKDSLYSQEKQRQISSYMFNEELRQQEIKYTKEQYNNRIKMYTLIAAGTIFLIIAVFLWLNNQHRRKAYKLLQRQKQETEIQKSKAEKTLEELKSTQAQLIQSEKMASLGELTAGIAHEIQNPLNFVTNFSEVNKELLVEMKDEIKKGNIDEVKVIADDVIENEQKINHHGKRADAIVKGMLQHSRISTGQKEPTDINALVDEYLRLAYYGLRAKDKSFNATTKTDFDESLSADDAGIGKINIVPQDIGRVLLNLFNNAFYSVTEKKKKLGELRLLDEQEYEPTVFVSTKKVYDKIEIRVNDNGVGIPQKVLDKIFQPFFTTKPTGQGTGLGLSLSYDIIKAHGGQLKMETKEGEFAEFIIQLPNG